MSSTAPLPGVPGLPAAAAAPERPRLSTAAPDLFADHPARDAVVDQAARYATAAAQALPAMYLEDGPGFVQTARRSQGGALAGEGSNLRYAAIAALGLARTPESTQRAALGGRSSVELTRTLVAAAAASTDIGATALVAWASAELDQSVPQSLLSRLADSVSAGAPLPTVSHAWILTALVALQAADRGAGRADHATEPSRPDEIDIAGLADAAADRLIQSQGARGVFPHALPRESLGRFRSHVGCFADQVYPIQALARYHASTGDSRALEAASQCADTIVRLQGAAGQWWWHYDVRTGGVVEGFPVYSVHQHAMAPMALLDLAAAGGPDHRDAIALGLSWIASRPETAEPLLDPLTGAIWRKVGRREKRKAVRVIRSISTSVSPRLRLGVLDRAFPPGPVDHECRPYELGWLLYAWLAPAPLGGDPRG